ncbi:phosphoglycerate kinase [Erwinia piriflorinigrans]|uniref:Phosphoglycerate kinase n=1 Tax=Erwinia piriflorinigrans CFBP 5888 TaxID=1161919 RepID=V5ZA05_9GAMM|nr:phosphoglycerate kinase [Erwinia piriflorinigrans]CCG88055.1 Bifunctional PGK/TIM Phosphoglycerate kinase [Erwinia piriflorinigrans CFBP 5888]
MSAASPMLFSAGMNINRGVKDHPRIDEEIDSLRPLVNEGSRIIILNHQGDYAKGTAEPTPWLASLLAERLKRPVDYFDHCIGPEALRYGAHLPPGSITIMGNTRLYPQEQQNDADFARQLAGLGEQLVIGGFSKLHRLNASNSAIKKFIPWRYSLGVQAQLDKLDMLQTQLFQNKKTILILGGNKKEKLHFLFNHALLPGVDRVIVGGLVLNSVLKARGLPIGRSEYFRLPHDVLYSPRLFIPQIVIVRAVSGDLEQRHVTHVRENDVIVDFVFDAAFFADIKRPGDYSFFAAGPLSLPQSQYAHLAYQSLHHKGIEGLFMGGDTLSEVNTFSYCSSGGGAVLHFFSVGY